MNRKALFVGIDKYTRGIQELSCARNDADSLYDYFKRLRYEVRIMHDVTTTETLDELETQMNKLQPDDLFLFFFAGHGYTVEGKEGLDRRLAGSSDRRGRILSGQDGISLRELKDCAKRARCACVVILDACQTKIKADRDASAMPCEEYSQRDLAAISSVVMEGSDPDSEQPFVVINSCDVGEVAYELTKEHQGLFSSSLLKVLSDMEKNGENPSFDKSFINSVAEQMKLYGAEYKQQPTIIANNSAKDKVKIFPIATELNADVRKWLSRLEEYVDIKVKHFVENIFVGGENFKYSGMLRNLIRLFSQSRPDKLIKPSEGAEVIKAFYEFKQLLERPAFDECQGSERPSNDGLRGNLLTARDKKLLEDLVLRLEIGDIGDLALNRNPMMSQTDAADRINGFARTRMRQMLSGKRHGWLLYSPNEYAKWKVRARKGFDSIVEAALYELIKDDMALSGSKK